MVQKIPIPVNVQKVIYEMNECHRQQAAVFSVKQFLQMFVCVCSWRTMSVSEVKKEKQTTSNDAYCTTVIKSLIVVLHHSTLNFPSWPAAPAKC